MSRYYTYIIRCEDGTLYTGITTDIVRREREHIAAGRRGAKYTRSHKALAVVAAWQSESRSDASRLEFYIKHLNRRQKDRLVSENDMRPLRTKTDTGKYKRVFPGTETGECNG